MGEEPDDQSLSGSLLDKILKALDLTYDASVGLLDGELIRQIPPVATLDVVEKLLTSLLKELKETERIDQGLLKQVRMALGEPEEDENVNLKKRKASQAFGDEKSNDDGDDDDDDMAVNVDGNDNDVKKEEDEGEDGEDDVKQEAPKSVSIATVNSGTGGRSNKDTEKDNEEDKSDKEVDDDEEVVEEEDDDDDDEDDVSLAKRKRSTPFAKKIKLQQDEDYGSTPIDSEKEEIVLKQKLKPNLNSKDDPVPPVQTVSATQGNDTRLKNPKSEYVEPQTLSKEAIAELGLFSADDNGLETQGTEYLKKLYGVASYPERDLQDMLPGAIPNIDFSKNKPPANQVQFTTFQSYIESYFRPFSDEDIKFLKEDNIVPPGVEKSYDPDSTPFIIPKLGQFYADVWTEEDANLGAKLNSPAYKQPSIETYMAKGNIDNLYDEKLYSEEISCGPLSSRLLLAILSTHEGKYFEEGDLDDDEKLESTMDENVATQLSLDDNYKFISGSNDFYSLEERLKRELKYIGIFMNVSSGGSGGNEGKEKSRKASKVGNVIVDNDEWIKNKEDDEVCAEIRELQQELREAVVRNRLNRKRLIPVVEEQIAYQEYCSILEDLDKQVDQAYIKRLKSKNKKKKVETTQTAQQQAANIGLRALLEKRKKWISNIGGIFKAPEIMKRVPDKLILSVKDNNNDNTTNNTSISNGGDNENDSIHEVEVKVEAEAN